MIGLSSPSSYLARANCSGFALLPAHCLAGSEGTTLTKKKVSTTTPKIVMTAKIILLTKKANIGRNPFLIYKDLPQPRKKKDFNLTDSLVEVLSE